MLILAVVGLAAVVLRTFVKSGGLSLRLGEQKPEAEGRPTELFGLDLREESVPEDVAGRARQLWTEGERLGALRLLYRSALSRLILGDDLPVTRSATEGDCLRLASLAISAERLEYFRILTESWQSTAYGHHVPDHELGQYLIGDWYVHFGGTA